MKLIVVLLTHIDNLPPARSLLMSLAKKDVDVKLITMYSYALPEEIRQNPRFEICDLQEKIETNRIKCLFNRFARRKKLRALINAAAPDDIIWTVTDYDAMECGDALKGHRHVMQLMELIEDIPVFDELPFYKAHIDRHARNAVCVVVPEINRAFIQQTMWHLKNTPFVLPNKPTVPFSQKNMPIKDETARAVIEKIKDKKIVLYQGVFGYERVLDQFIEAVEKLGDDYCMLLMGRDDEESRKLRAAYPKAHFIPFLSAPEHLTVTSYAHVGVLSYVNHENIRHFMPLNAVYCAPNKIYEYAAFGVPMVGNCIPGLLTPFSHYRIGECAKKLTSDAIARAILKIESDYENMSRNCRTFYEDTDFDSIVGEILAAAQGD